MRRMWGTYLPVSPLCLAPSCIGERLPKKPWSRMVVVKPQHISTAKAVPPQRTHMGSQWNHNLVTNDILFHHGVKTQRIKWAVFWVLTFGMRGGVVLRTYKIAREVASAGRVASQQYCTANNMGSERPKARSDWLLSFYLFGRRRNLSRSDIASTLTY